MKISLTKLKSSLLMTVALAIVPAWGKPVAQVTQAKGQVFLVTADGKTKGVRVNDHVEEKSELMVGEDGSLTLNDYYDATYHLTGGSHLKFFDKSVQLKKGKTWIQSLNARHPLALTTANGHVGFWKGEFIVTFDQSSARSQVLVVNGEVEVSNVLDKNYKHAVAAGTFTMIDPEVENGSPRSPTKVGLESLNQALSEFKALPQQLKSPSLIDAPSRSIASEDSGEASVKSKGEILFINKDGKMNRLPAAKNSAYSYFKKKVVAQNKVSESVIPIRFFGVRKVSEQIYTRERNPASLQPKVAPAAPKKIGKELNFEQDFQNSLRLQKDKQPNHTKELENLIQDLKSY